MLKNVQYNLKYDLLAASANAIKMALKYSKPFNSYLNLHRNSNRATPNMFWEYKLARLFINIQLSTD
jgi:hypothetical protein